MISKNPCGKKLNVDVLRPIPLFLIQIPRCSVCDVYVVVCPNSSLTFRAPFRTPRQAVFRGSHRETMSIGMCVD